MANLMLKTIKNEQEIQQTIQQRKQIIEQAAQRPGGLYQEEELKFLVASQEQLDNYYSPQPNNSLFQPKKSEPELSKNLNHQKIITILDNPDQDRILALIQFYLPGWQVIYGSDNKPAIFTGDNWHGGCLYPEKTIWLRTNHFSDKMCYRFIPHEVSHALTWSTPNDGTCYPLYLGHDNHCRHFRQKFAELSNELWIGFWEYSQKKKKKQ